MNETYIKGKGILVGTFSENDLTNGTDKIETQKVKERTGLKYTNTSFVMKGKKITGLQVYVCNLDDMKL